MWQSRCQTRVEFDRLMRKIRSESKKCWCCLLQAGSRWSIQLKCWLLWNINTIGRILRDSWSISNIRGRTEPIKNSAQHPNLSTSRSFQSSKLVDSVIAGVPRAETRLSSLAWVWLVEAKLNHFDTTIAEQRRNRRSSGTEIWGWVSERVTKWFSRWMIVKVACLRWIEIHPLATAAPDFRCNARATTDGKACYHAICSKDKRNDCHYHCFCGLEMLDQKILGWIWQTSIVKTKKPLCRNSAPVLQGTSRVRHKSLLMMLLVYGITSGLLTRSQAQYSSSCIALQNRPSHMW